MEGTFTVKTEHFEGPLDLLLSLIEKRKLFISDISLAQVADDYIAHIKDMGQFPMDMTAHFILIASTLLLIKSKSLLPSMPLTEEEQGSIEDLERRLVVYKRIKESAKNLEKLFGASVIFPKTQSKIVQPVFSPDEDMNTLEMLTSIKRVLNELPKKEILQKTVVKKIMSLEEMIDRLTDRVTTSLKMSFSDFAKTQSKTVTSGSKHTITKEDRVHVIVSFLALLELVKQGIIGVTQESHTDDIMIETEQLSVPNYN